MAHRLSTKPALKFPSSVLVSETLAGSISNKQLAQHCRPLSKWICGGLVSTTNSSPEAQPEIVAVEECVLCTRVASNQPLS